MVFFTVFIQGSTIKFLVKLMGISLREKEEGPKKLCPQIQNTLIDNIMGAMETVIGRSGHFKLSQVFNHLDNQYFGKLLIASEKKETLEKALDKIILEEHYTSLYGPRIVGQQVCANTSTKKLDYTVSKNAKAWNEAIANTTWHKYQSKLDDELTAEELLEERRRRARTMENRILSSKQVEAETTSEIMQGVPLRREQSGRATNRKSMIASMIISEYDRVSTDKRRRLSLASTPGSPTSLMSPTTLTSPPIFERGSRKVSHGNPVFTIIPEDENDLESGM